MHPALKYFRYDKNDDYSYCIVNESCTVKLKGNHGTNLLKHLKRFHTKEHKIASQNPKRRRENEEPTSSKRMKMDEYVSRTTVKKVATVNFSDKTIIDACVELVTKNGRPFSILDDSGFRKILQPILKALGLTLNAGNIQSFVEKEADNWVDNIKSAVKDKIISVKFDCTTKHTRPILGTNIQYIKDDKIIVNNIGMSEMVGRSTGENIKTKIMEKFTQFGISRNNVYTFSIDNGANVLKTARLIRDSVQTETREYESDEDDEDDEDSSGDEESDEEVVVDDNDDDTSFLENQTFTDTVQETVTAMFAQNENHDDFAITIRCAAHCIQLPVNDALKTSRIKRLLKKSREVVKKLDTPLMRLSLKQENSKKPIKGSKVRWNSHYDMLHRLVQLKPFCLKYENVTPELRLSTSNWEDINELLEALKPIKILTKKVQSVQMTLSDFVGHYLKCRVSLLKMTHNEYAPILSNSMDIRQNLFSNNPILAAVYLDPRYQVILTSDDKKRAQQHLFSLHKRIHRSIETSSDRAEPVIVEADNANKSHDEEFESFLAQLERESNTEVAIESDEIPNFIKDFNGIQRVTFDKRKDETILTYWASQKHLRPELYELSQIVFAVPATQVTVERAFSTLDHVFGKRRGRVKSAILEKQLLVCLNRNFN